MDLFAALENWVPRERIVQDLDGLEKMVACLEDEHLIAVDVETTSLDHFSLELVGIGFATENNGSWYVPTGHKIDHPQLIVDTVINATKHIFSSQDKIFVFHNAKFDARVLHTFGIEVPCNIEDTVIMSQLLNSGTKKPNKLKVIAKQHLNIDMTELEEIAPDKNPANSSIYDTSKYCRMDAKCTLLLRNLFIKMIEEARLSRALHLELDILPIVIFMEETGAYIDIEKLKEVKRKVDVEVARYEKRIVEKAGVDFNINSTPQLSEVLFERLGIPKDKKKTKKGSAATDVESLKAILRRNPSLTIVEDILQYRKVSKLKSTYTDSILAKERDGKIYATFKQMGARTGRFSSKEPNLQNIPRTEEKDDFKVKNIFYAPEGFHLVVADYNQVELRVLAHYCGDENMIKAFSSGKDIHESTAAMMFDVPLSKVTKKQRVESKALNFGLVYGMRAYGLASKIGRYDDVRYAEQLMHKYFQTYFAVKPWTREVAEAAREKGYIRTLIGRKRTIYNLDSEVPEERAEAERIAVNSVVQGGAADIVKGAMIKVFNNRRLKELGAVLTIQVHDELVFLVPDLTLDESVDIIRVEMEHPFKRDLRIPLTVEIGVARHWGDAK